MCGPLEAIVTKFAGVGPFVTRAILALSRQIGPVFTKLVTVTKSIMSINVRVKANSLSLFGVACRWPSCVSS